MLPTFSELTGECIKGEQMASLLPTLLGENSEQKKHNACIGNFTKVIDLIVLCAMENGKVSCLTEERLKYRIV